MLLMCRDIPVCEVSIRRGQIWEIGQFFSRENLPVGVFAEDYPLGKDPQRDADLLNGWYRNQAIPSDRDSLKAALGILGVESPEELKTIFRGLSLLNPYWLKKEDEQIRWKDVNFWDNPFTEEIGEALFNRKPLSLKLGQSPSPDGGLPGVLKKKWKVFPEADEAHRYYLLKDGTGEYKQEVFNEILAARIMDAAKIPHAEYCYYEEEGSPVCLSRCFCARNIELIPMLQVWDSLPLRIRREHLFGFPDYEKAITILEYYHVKDAERRINEMLVLDYILAGTDRHLNNFGMLHNLDSGEFTFAPIYDSGTCLWKDKRIAEKIDGLKDADIVARPFGGNVVLGYWNVQRKYIKQYIPLTSKDLRSALLEYYENLTRITQYPKQRAGQIVLLCMQRAIQLQEMLKEKNVTIPSEFLYHPSDLEQLAEALGEQKEEPSFPEETESDLDQTKK